ncbi:SpoIID/LytB domain-containing protein [Paenibacillus sp. FSL K6-2524]|uniref:SpoIID/LytB domain-containing protein n=1 Tax=Paenibacillus sp. FSL K6-2524 TaxID=2954516 RepID=UPI0030F5545C
MKDTKRTFAMVKWGKGILAGLLLATALQLPASADSLPDTRVRVAMYLDMGTTYRSTIPAVTLKADSAWKVSPQNVWDAWANLAAGESVRFSVDGYKIKALQSSDWNVVSAAAKKLQNTTDRPVVFALDQPAGTVYQIFTGPYASVDEANKAASRVESSISSQLGGQKPVAKGSNYYSVGTFGSQGEAESLRQSLTSQGIDAVAVLTGPQQYAVWTGGATSEAELTLTKGQLDQVGGNLQITVVNNTDPALILHRDVTLNLTTPSAVSHYELSGNGAKFMISGNGDMITQVVERSARKYRGEFEVSSVNGQLALVNELPLEQYLYSVVAAEVPSSWPKESLKAQAVAARSYALYNAGINKFKVAGLVDTTLSQVYNGVDNEVASVIQAVDSTAGEVIKSNGKVVEGIFSSNSGGVTADSSEVWNSINSTFTSVGSDEDKVAQSSLKSWYYVLLSNGATGYVREDNVVLSGSNTSAGLSKLTVTSSAVNVRPLPLIQSDVNPVAKINPGDQVIALAKVDESSSYAWIRGPFTSDQLLKSLKGKVSPDAPSPIINLEVSQRGPSGRVTEVKANGQVLGVKNPDSLRSALNGLPSTLFDIVATGRYTVQGAGDITTTGTATTATTVLSASGSKTWSGGNMVVMDGSGTARVVDQNNQFMFVGKGYGHGIGMSQWGAKGMADAGYDYLQILQHYYQNVTITKD